VKEFTTSVLTIKDVAEYLDVKPITVYKMSVRRRIPAIKIAGSWRFKRELIEDWAKTRRRRTINIPLQQERTLTAV